MKYELFSDLEFLKFCAPLWAHCYPKDLKKSAKSWERNTDGRLKRKRDSIWLMFMGSFFQKKKDSELFFENPSILAFFWFLLHYFFPFLSTLCKLLLLPFVLRLGFSWKFARFWAVEDIYKIQNTIVKLTF